MRIRNWRGRPKNPEYPQWPDGTPVVGPGCFSGGVLKRRFESVKDAKTWIHKRNQKDVKPYKCNACKGVHLTTVKEGKK